jgi:hypothetical protein
MFAHRMAVLRAGQRSPVPARCRAYVACAPALGVPCECARRNFRIRTIAKVIALQHFSPDFPAVIPLASLGPYYLYHLPIFTFVCPVCRRREDSYTRTLLDQPKLDASDLDWCVSTYELSNEQQQIFRYAYDTVYLCSRECLLHWHATHGR